MAKVICAAVECRWNDDYRCRAKGISLRDGHVHTRHQGYKHIWECKQFEMSEQAKEFMDALKLQTKGGDT